MSEAKDNGKSSCFVMFVWTSALAEVALATFQRNTHMRQQVDAKRRVGQNSV
jgi:hypothetical protein